MLILREQTATAALNRVRSIKSITVILETIHKPLELVMEERKCTMDEAIQHKKVAEEYIRKYGIQSLKDSARHLEEVLRSK